MLKKFKTILPHGQDKQVVSLLNRRITLYHGEIVSESLITQTFPRFFKVLENTKQEKKQELLLDESSNVSVNVEVPNDLPVQEVETIQAAEIVENTDENKPKTRTRKTK